jgi:starch synthase
MDFSAAKSAIMGEPIRVLFIASEAEPFVKIGGLGDVAGSLPRFLRALPPDVMGGHELDVRLAIPHYRAIRTEDYELQSTFSFPVGTRHGPVQALVSTTHANGLPVYLIGGEPFQKRGPVYSFDAAEDGPKFAFFSAAVVELLRGLNESFHILHANDWHTAAAVYALAVRRSTDAALADTRTVLTIHNLPFLGIGTGAALQEYGLPPTTDDRLPEWARDVPLPLGLLSADRIVAVSPTYAREILTPEFGSGLDAFLRMRAGELRGILNGIDIAAWNPATDPDLPVNYDRDHLNRRARNAAALREELSLSNEPGIPLLAIISRMDRQKGIDLALTGLRRLIELPWQIVILGSGDPKIEEAARKLQSDFSQRVRAVPRFDSRLAHRLYGGADILLMPSRYEPCGLAQMIAMRYGCLPLARATGGLRDTIHDGPDYRENTGFLFRSASAEGFMEGLYRALDAFAHPSIWKRMQHNAMDQDFSWENSARQYAQIYMELVGGIR